MRHFAMMCPDTGGHLGPMLSLARALQSRGHRVTFFQSSNLSRRAIESGGIAFRCYGSDDNRIEANSLSRRLAESAGWRGFRATIVAIRESTAQCLQSAPKLLREERIDALLTDEVIACGLTIAELLSIPCVVLSIALLLEGEPAIPPFFTTWNFRDDWFGLARNRVAYAFLRRTLRPLREDMSRHRARLGLDPNLPRGPFAAPVARICQQPAEFEFPRRHLPDRLHFVGSMADPSLREPVDFPFDRLDVRPLIYASLGTVMGTKREIFRRIAEACAPLNAQLVISLGGRGTPAELGELPGAPLVVIRAPQLEILKRAALCVTHAGLNTTLECLAEGVPMVAIPLVNDAPGVAARIAWSGCGLYLTPSRITAPRLRNKIRQIFDNPQFRKAASRMREAINRAGGVERAADIIEAAIRKSPITRGL